MRKIAYISTVLLLNLLFSACSGEEILITADQPVEITFNTNTFTKVVTSTKSGTLATTRATEMPGSEAENTIADLNLFLFGTSDVKHYYFSSTSTPVGSEWTHTATDGTGTIKLSLSQAEAGTRDVCIVANYGSSLSSVSSSVSSIDDLRSTLLYKSTNTPWSPTLSGSSILMSGNKTHDFIANRILGEGVDNTPVRLTRALAKVELNITLKPEHQSTPVVQEGVTGDLTPVNQYHYAFLNFDKNTYVLKPAEKGSDLTAPGALSNLLNPSSEGWSWTVWNSLGDYEFKDGDETKEVTQLTMVTYINERDMESPAKPLSSIAISMPYNGAMPPPEFGPDVTQVFLPATIERNYWYVYDIEI